MEEWKVVLLYAVGIGGVIFIGFMIIMGIYAYAEYRSEGTCWFACREIEDP